MIAVDSNVLIYAHRPDTPLHRPAAAAVRDLAENLRPWVLLWPCLHEFYSVVTHKRIYAVPTPPDRAIQQIAAWMSAPTVRLLTETPSHFTVLQQLLVTGEVTGPAVHDAKIAAICLSHGVRELLTMDRDFSRYPGLKTRSLLA